MNKMYLLFDERARTQGTQGKVVLYTADTEEEVLGLTKFHSEHNPGSVWYEYTIISDKLTRGKMRLDLSLGLSK